ncbi:MAG: tetratricopeptide repeat protein [Pyrinomonadaceae bacterium]
MGVAANKKLEGGPEMQAALRRALEINPRLVEAHALQATAFIESGRYNEASTAIEAALKINPNSLDAIALRVALLYLQDRDYSAVAKSALAINPRYGKLYDTLAHFATITRRYHQAVESLRKQR